MAADDPIGLVEGLRRLGPRWGPLAGVLLLCAGVIWYRWQLGYRAIQDFARDPLLSSVLVVAGAGAATFYYLYGLPRDFAPGEIGILVAPVPGDMHRAEQNSYINVIRALVSNDATLAGFVKVRLLRRQLPEDPEEQHDSAVKLGRRLGASFVIRAIPQVGGHVCWLSVVDLPEFPSDEAALAKVTQKQLGELEELPLPQDITLLAKCALALSDYRRSIYPQAIEQLEQILTAKALPDAAPARAHLNFLLGNCFGYARSADPATLLPRAVSAYDAALREWSRDRYPTDWATTMNNRGTAYRELPSPDRAANLQEAIRCYELALEEWRKHGFAHYAEVTRSNLSRARLLLAGHSRPS